jgi:CHAT domain-containing protein/Flp pilus assembly protein TadD
MRNIFEIKGYVTYDDTNLHLVNLNNQFFAYQIEKTMFFKNFRILCTFFLLSIFNYSIGQTPVDSISYYYKKSDYQKAINYGEKEKNNYVNSGNIISSEYAELLSNLAVSYKAKRDFVKAESMYLQSLNIFKEVKGENNDDYATLLNNLAILYDDQNMDEKAEKLFLQSLEIRKKLLGENHPDYASSLNNLAGLYFKQGKYEKAETLSVQFVNIRKEVLGENHPDYATALHNLAMLYNEEGKYEKVEPLYLQSLNIYKKNYGENHPDYAGSLNQLASLYEHQGKYQKAETLYLQSLNIYKEIYGENNLKYGGTLNNLASLYQEQGKFEKAEILFLQSLNIRKEVLGEHHTYYALSLNNLSGLYYKQEKYEKVEPLFLHSLDIIKEALGEQHPYYALSLTNLATLYVTQKKYDKAEPMYLQALEIQKKVLGENHPDFAASLEDLALLYDKQGKAEKSSFFFNSSFLILQNQLKKAITYLPENELRFFSNKYLSERFFPLSFLHHYPTQYQNTNIACYENELLVKNLSLRNQQRISNGIKKSGNVVLQNKYEQYLSKKRQLAKMGELPLKQRSINYELLSNETETLEIELVRQSALFSDAKNSFEVNWKQVQKKLKPNEITIDLVAYNFYNKKWTDSIVYAVFVGKKEFNYPKYIPLFEEKQLDFLLDRNKTEKDNISIDKQYIDKAISDLFLKPLENEMGDINTIYLSTSGMGHQIDFAALPINETQTLGEKYKLHILNAPSELIDFKEVGLKQKNKLELLLYGGINYGKSDSEEKTENTITDNSDDFTNLITRSGIRGFNYIEGTNKEVNQIQQKATQNGFTVKLLNESAATEESIKALDGRTTPYVLHLATHGFFFADLQQKELPNDIMRFEGKAKIYKASDDPMMRSGLLFAGANNYWGKSNDDTTIDDGILTASEISNLDLSACQLVVLSACETGLGEVKGSEGVFGLQRAFKMAGVKNIIMSLWKVPDTQTAELFDIFYSECFAGKSIHEAFQSAQAKMKVKYSPYYWAGFVLLE